MMQAVEQCRSGGAVVVEDLRHYGATTPGLCRARRRRRLFFLSGALC